MVFLLSLTIVVADFIFSSILKKPAKNALRGGSIISTVKNQLVELHTSPLSISPHPQTPRPYSRPYKLVHPLTFEQYQLIRYIRSINHIYNDDMHRSMPRVGATMARRSTDPIFSLKIGKEFTVDIDEASGAVFTKNWDSHTSETRYSFPELMTLLIAAPGILNYVIDFVQDIKDSDQSKSDVKYLTPSKAIFFSSKMGEKKNKDTRYTNVRIADCYLSGTGDVKSISANSLSFRSGEVETFVNKIPELLKCLVNHYRQFHLLHIKQKYARDNCEFCQAMMKISDEGPLTFTRINLFKPLRSITTRPPSSGSNTESAKTTDEEEGDRDGVYTPQQVLDVLWPHIDT